MGDRYLTRRAAIRYGAIGLLGGVGASANGRAQTMSNRIVVSNREYDGSATYEFEVTDTVEPLDSPAGDNVDGSRAWGSVHGWEDGYQFSGEVISFSHDGPVDVYVNGEEVDPSSFGDGHRIDIEGDGSKATYEFTVSGEVTGGSGLGGDDSYSGSSASGAVYGWTDTYTYTGEVSSFSHEGSVRVYVDGEEVDPTTLGGGTNWRKLVVSNQGYDESAAYEFEVTETVEPATSPAGDNADGSRAWGAVYGWKDGYRFVGDVVSFSHDGPVDVFVDGVETDPSVLDSGDGDGTSIRTRGTPLHDTDDWSGWSSATGATQVTADDSVAYRGSAALRFDVSDGSLAARYDPGSTLDLSGRRLSLALKWATPDRFAKLFVTLVDSGGGRSEWTVSAPSGMTGTDQGWVRCPTVPVIGGPDDADPTDVESIELSAWSMASGRIWVDDIRVHDQPDRGRVAFTFDDSHQSRRAAVEVFDERGVAGTLFVITHRVGDDGQVTLSDLDDAKAAGWTVGSHPQHDDSLAAMTGSEAADAMDADRQWLSDHGFDPDVMAWPYGSFDTEAIEAADERYGLVFSGVGSPTPGEISTPMNVGRLNGNAPDDDGDGIPDDPKWAIDRAAEFGGLTVLNYHNVDMGGDYSISSDLLGATVDYALDADVDIVTCRDLLP